MRTSILPTPGNLFILAFYEKEVAKRIIGNQYPTTSTPMIGNAIS